MLNKYENLGVSDVLSTIPTSTYIIVGIVSLIFGLIVFFVFLEGLNSRIITATIWGSIYLLAIFFFIGIIIFNNSSVHLRRDRVLEIANLAIEENLDLEVTDKYLVYNGKTYEHKLSNIDDYVITDKNGNLIITYK